MTRKPKRSIDADLRYIAGYTVAHGNLSEGFTLRGFHENINEALDAVRRGSEWGGRAQLVTIYDEA